MKNFPELSAGEKRVLTFDFSDDLDVGETLTGAIVVSVSMEVGTDATPAAILNGAADYDATSKMVLQGVQVLNAGCGYRIKMLVPTTNPKKVLALSGILPVTG